ncbi:MAG: pyruvate, phosphate dikinase [Candidatus Hydrogenedentes bacterium]|nr:pyruvate, phosphate dikinase [Candidatus Hydrogenedentota bacterium]
MSSDVTTGLPALDDLLHGIMLGDNIVWQVGSVEAYGPFAGAFAARAIEQDRPMVYFRFGRHAPLLLPQAGLTIHELDPNAGFEFFVASIHEEIARAGRGAFFVFDCLSDLVADWFSDHMLGNFFMLTCPYLFDLHTVAYFALLRDYHTDAAVTPIRKTTQLWLDVYRHEGKTYVKPVKVRQRVISSMHLLHVEEGNAYRPVTESHVLAEVLRRPGSSAGAGAAPSDVWMRAFGEAQQLLEGSAAVDPEERKRLLRRLLRMQVSRDGRVLALAERYLGIEDVVAIRRRTIGTGLIGGKAVGMLLGQAILRRSDPRWIERLEMHDSFFVASDVFYTFLVENGCWWLRKNLRDREAFQENAGQVRRRILSGEFSERVLERFGQMLEYYGRSPIIVRSSSLLEDNFGNAFAGKYESVFCANQGPLEQRFDEFLDAVKTVYASSMSEEAVAYRARHRLMHLDEQMALLVQRVSGADHGGFFYPHLAGVGFSFNPYVWSRDIDPEAGLLRLVFGLGTRAVDRHDDDYTRIIALNAPERRPEGDSADGARYSQHYVDLLDLRENTLRTERFEETVNATRDLPLDLVAPIHAATRRERGEGAGAARRLTFAGLIRDTAFVAEMREMLETLEWAYQYPVDIEFAANAVGEREYKLNLLQCRPLHIHGGAFSEAAPSGLKDEDIVLHGTGPVIGRSRAEPVQRVILVEPGAYAALHRQERYAVARLVGRLAHARPQGTSRGCLLLIGPGRWGTQSPETGVPVMFGEINTVDVLCEVVAMREDLVPDVSMGTHFFSELVEMDMLYVAVFPDKAQNRLNLAALTQEKNLLLELAPDAVELGEVVRVYDPTHLRIHADTIRQEMVCYWENEE